MRMRKLFEVDTAPMTDDELWEHYEACLIAHDWTFNFSDDGRVWREGMDEQEYLNSIRERLGEVDLDRSQKLYWHHSFFHNNDGTFRDL